MPILLGLAVGLLALIVVLSLLSLGTRIYYARHPPKHGKHDSGVPFIALAPSQTQRGHSRAPQDDDGGDEMADVPEGHRRTPTVMAEEGLAAHDRVQEERDEGRLPRTHSEQERAEREPLAPRDRSQSPGEREQPAGPQPPIYTVNRRRDDEYHPWGPMRDRISSGSFAKIAWKPWLTGTPRFHTILPVTGQHNSPCTQVRV